MKRVLLALFAIVDVYSGHMIFRDEIPNSLNVEHTAAVGHMSKTVSIKCRRMDRCIVVLAIKMVLSSQT